MKTTMLMLLVLGWATVCPARVKDHTFDVTGTVSADDGTPLQDVEVILQVETPVYEGVKPVNTQRGRNLGTDGTYPDYFFPIRNCCARKMGNVPSVPGLFPGITNTYDFENHLLTHAAVSVVYDGDGNRASETVGSTTTKYLVDTLNPTGYSQVLDELVSGAVTKTYTYGLQRISENQLIGSTWTPSFYGYDGHGSVRFLANTAGTITDTYQFDAFGMPVASTGTTANTYLYSGERFDSSLNLYHLRARYYNMLTGRFETMDPGKETCCALRASQIGNVFDPATLHKYVYAKNNPVNWTDPSGRAIEDYEGLTFEDIIQTYKGVKNIARESAAALCFDAAAVYAVQYPNASIQEILAAEVFCLKSLGF